jgi:hypothetical protein
MSGLLHPTRISTFELSKPDVVTKVKAIAKTKMPVDWKWGLEPFSRANPPPNVRASRGSGIPFPEYSYMHMSN